MNAGDVMFDGTSTGCQGPGITKAAIAGTGGSRGLNVAYCPAFFAQQPRDRAATVVHEAVHHFGVEDISAFLDDDHDGVLEASDVDGVRDQVLVNDPGAAQDLALVDPEA